MDNEKDYIEKIKIDIKDFIDKTCNGPSSDTYCLHDLIDFLEEKYGDVVQ